MAFQLSATDPQAVFGAIAGLIFLGFLGNLLFSRLRVNDTLLLILIGMMLGPVAEHWFGSPVIDRDPLVRLSGVIGPLALILILFDGGLALKFHDLRHGAASAAGLGLLSFVFTTAAVGGVTAWALDIPLITGLILGAILGGTSALVVMPSLEHVQCKRKTATTLGLESAITDVLVVVVAMALTSVVVLGQTPDAQGLTSGIGATFILALLFGFAAGIAWLYMLAAVRERPFGYMLTLGVMFALFVGTEWFLGGLGRSESGATGGGPLAVLAFGILLGNHEAVSKYLHRKLGADFGTGMKRFQGEISFLVRTFFFVYLGILVELSLFADLWTWALGIVLFAAIMAARYISVAAVVRRFKLKADDWILWTMVPRGLAAAVLAAEPMAQGIAGTERFVALAFIILVMTNLSTTVGALVLEKLKPKPGSKGVKFETA